MTSEEEILQLASLNGLVFGQDSEKVMQIIKEFHNVTLEEALIKQVNYGRVSMHKLREHLGGKSEGERWKTQAREALNKLNYCHEHTLPFENYITVLKSNFQVLERFDDTL